MATRAHMIGGGAAALPFDLSPMLSAIPSLPRPLLARLVSRMIDRLDELDGDDDLELSGDETGTSNAEDEHRFGPSSFAEAGCPIADPGGCEHDGREPLTT